LSPEITPADAEWIPDGEHRVAGLQAAGRAHRCRHDVVGQRLRLQHRQVVLGALADEVGLRLVAVHESDEHAARAGDHVQVGEDHAGLDDHYAGAALPLGLARLHALGALLAVVGHGSHGDHGRQHFLVGVGGVRRRILLFEHALHQRFDLLG